MSKVEQFNEMLTAFKIKARCVSHSQIGTSSSYNLVLDPKCKIKDLEKYAQEFALSLQEKSCPKFNPILDKGIVVAEFIKPITNSINLSELIMNKSPSEDADLPILLGVDAYGKDVWMNMEDNPHLLLAGCTGSGKSVALHNIIGNLIKYSSAEIHLVDPKGIEFYEYEKLKNFNVKYTYEDTINLLNYLHSKMENRFQLMKLGLEFDSFDPIVLIIDEYADLSLQDVDRSLYIKLCKLAQKCRAAKIHLILATQRPSAKLIDGNIKANFPARLACKVSSKIDSKIILDSSGAEELVGKGDSLLTNYSNSKLRLKIAYTNPSENKKFIQ